MIEQTPQLYPTGSQPFEIIRQRGLLYIDKTDFIYKMTHLGTDYIFLSRPRRFGKSLLVSTLKAYFEGKKDLFKGLKIENLEKEWQEYPVLHFDLSLSHCVSKDALERYLANLISINEKRLGVEISEGDINIRIQNLIECLYEKTGKQVVVLIDEYDAPILNVIDRDSLEDIRDSMKNFFSPLKGSVAYLKFVFLTGITKFSQLSLFSKLNNIKNISMEEDYASICGITEDEMLTCLKPGIESLAQKQGYSYEEAVERLKYQYDGYHFTWPSPDIYNPYSLLNALSDRKISFFWFETATPTFLIEILKKYDVTPNNIGERYAGENEFDAPTETMIDELPLLYQTGYLTIKGYSNDEEQQYFLDIPNKEVRVGLMDNLLPQYVAPNKINEARRIIKDLSRAIREERIDDALKELKTFLSTIPQTDNTDYEGHYQCILYVVFYILGSYQQDVEVHTPRGRVDMVLRTRTHLYLFELKFNKSAREAIEQINIKNYSERFALSRLPIVKVGINFSSETRSITDWIIE